MNNDLRTIKYCIVREDKRLSIKYDVLEFDIGIKPLIMYYVYHDKTLLFSGCDYDVVHNEFIKIKKEYI